MVKVTDLCPASLGSIPTGTHMSHLVVIGSASVQNRTPAKVLHWYLGTMVGTSEPLNNGVSNIKFTWMMDFLIRNDDGLFNHMYLQKPKPNLFGLYGWLR